jgi:hypothetical protein
MRLGGGAAHKETRLKATAAKTHAARMKKRTMVVFTIVVVGFNDCVESVKPERP